MHVGMPAIDRHAALRAGDVLEAVGGAGCGKTELLVQAAVTCLLPEQAEGVRYGGLAGGVLFLDLDGKLDAARVPSALSRRISRCRAASSRAPPQSAPDASALAPLADAVYSSSLARFTLLRCRSSAEVVQACAALDALLVARQASADWQNSAASTRLLLVDNLGAHYWLEKAVRLAPLPAGVAAFTDRCDRPAVLDARTVQGALAAAVRSAATRRRLLVIATKHSFSSPTPPPPGPPAGGGGAGCAGPCYREYMCKAWQTVVSHRLTLYKPDPSRGRVAAHWAAPLQAAAGDLIGEEGCEG